MHYNITYVDLPSFLIWSLLTSLLLSCAAPAPASGGEAAAAAEAPAADAATAPEAIAPNPAPAAQEPIAEADVATAQQPILVVVTPDITTNKLIEDSTALPAAGQTGVSVYTKTVTLTTYPYENYQSDQVDPLYNWPCAAGRSKKPKYCRQLPRMLRSRPS